MHTRLRCLDRAFSSPVPWVTALLLMMVPDGFAQQIVSVTVTGTDYAFAVPVTLAPGLTAFAFQNHGQVAHEMVLLRLKSGVTLDSLLQMARGAPRRALTQGVGILVADPGETPLGQLLVDLTPGQTYVLLCNLQDTPDQPRHTALGMVASFQVK